MLVKEPEKRINSFKLKEKIKNEKNINFRGLIYNYLF
jgi:hypothetical protein